MTPEFFKSTDTWFLIFMIMALGGVVALLGGYLLWSLKGIFNGFTSAVEELRKLISKLTDQHNSHEARITAVETRCETIHGIGPHRSQQ